MSPIRSYDLCSWCTYCCTCGKDESDPSTPLPKGKFLVVAGVLFVNQFGLMMIFPFLPFMIHDFFPELSRQELGRKAGFLGGVYFIGSFSGSLMWGWVSDLVGRRPVMLFGIFATIGTELFFGFSQNFAWALAARFIWGFLGAEVGVVKTYVSEICDDSNQARGFAVIGTTLGLGRLTGSIAGGFLAQPANKYSLLQVPFFCKFPYLLPCLVGAAIGVLSLIGGYFFLDETLHTKIKKRRTSKSERSSDSDRLLPSLDSGDEMSNWQQGEVSDADESLGHLGAVKHKSWDCSQQCDSCVMISTCCLNCTPRKLCTLVCAKLRAGGAILKMMLPLIRDRRVFISTSLIGILAFVSLMTQELYPLLVVTSYKHGGYNFDDNEIGIVLTAASVFQLSSQLLVYPPIAKCLGYRKTLQIAAMVFALTCVLLPLSNKITGPVNGTASPLHVNITGSGSAMNLTDYCGNDVKETLVNNDSMTRIPWYVWIALFLIVGVMVMSRTNAFTSALVLVNNSALPETRGTVNGIGQTLEACGSAVGPVVASTLFAWSESNGLGWPVNYHFVFYICVLVVFLVVVLTFFLPKTIETKRDTLEKSIASD